jgi:mono/diheme cytochrome c family protein
MVRSVAYALVAVVFAVAVGALYIHFDAIPRYEVESIDLRVQATPERIARGKKLATILCASCHMDPTTRTLTGKRSLDVPAQFGVVYSTNITRHPVKGIGRWSDGEIAYLLRTGVRRDGQYLPPWMVKLPHMADEDIASIVAFLRSDDPMVAPAASDPPGVSEPTFLTKFLSHVAFRKLPYPTRPIPMPNPSDEIAWGRYLVVALDCYGCHSADFKTVNILQPEKTPGYLGGGNQLVDLRGKPIWSANITFDEETGIGKWSGTDFARAMKKSLRPDNAPIRYPMEPLPELSDDEVRAIYAYLRSVPKIKNSVTRRRDVEEVPANAAEGRKIYYKYACVSCHGDNGIGIADLRRAAEHFPTDEALQAWIKNAPAIKPETKMPAWDGVIEESEYATLIVYVKELGAKAPAQD